MAKHLKIATVACAGVVASGLAVADYVAGDGRSGARHDEAVVVAVAPPQHMPRVDPAVNPIPSLPNSPPLPQRAPDIPSIDMASAKDSASTTQDAKPNSFGDAASIAVASRPTLVRSGPSETAAMLYGFPAGREVRVMGTEAGFAQIKDVESGAQGWVEKSALASGMLTASIEPRPARSAPVRQARAEIDGPKPVTEIEGERHNPRLPDGALEDAVDNGSKTNFAGLLRRGFGAN
jgi:hypothetical protein